MAGRGDKSPSRLDKILRPIRSLSAGSSLSERDRKLNNMDRSRSRNRDGLQNPPVLPFYTSGMDEDELENLQDIGFFHDPTSPTPARASAPPANLMSNPRPLSPEILIDNSRQAQAQSSNNPFSAIPSEHKKLGDFATTGAANKVGMQPPLMDKNQIIQHLLDRDAAREKTLEKMIGKLKLVNEQVNGIESRYLNENCFEIEPRVSPPPFDTTPNAMTKSSQDTMKKSLIFFRPFKDIPIFKGEKDNSVVDFLETLTAAVVDHDLKICEPVFITIVLSKLSHTVRMAIGEGELYLNKNCAEIYRSLLCLYDFSETEPVALMKLLKLKGDSNITNFSQYFAAAMKYLRLCGANPSDKSKHFLISLNNILPQRIKERLDDHIHNYRRKNHSGSYPPIEWILNIISPHRDELDMAILQQSKHKEKIKLNVLEVEEKQKPVAQCDYCGMDNHSTARCYKRLKDERANSSLCSDCGKKGHQTGKCKSRCRLCHDPSHKASACPIYPNTLITQSKCEHCFSVLHLALFHPMKQCKQGFPIIKSAKN